MTPVEFSRIKLKPKGKEYLIRKYDSLPKTYVVMKDVVARPVDKLGWIIGFIASVIAIYQWWEPPAPSLTQRTEISPTHKGK